MKESDIRPQELFNKYLELSRRDIDRFFSDQSSFTEVPCPACGSERFRPGLEKLGFRYVTCSDCGSLYVSPRPTSEMIDAYYVESEAVQFWGTDFFRKTAEARRQAIFEPRARLVKEWSERLIQAANKSETVVDVGCGYGIFLEELKKLGQFEQIIGIEPAKNLASICAEKGFKVIEKRAEDVSGDEIQAGFATAFEVLEHLYDPAEFLKAVFRILRPGGVFLGTTLTVDGFDIQVLWEHSKSIYPPHHINLLSVEGMERLVERTGFEMEEISTPGVLDIDIVYNMVRENEEIALPRFIQRIIYAPHEAVKKNFQKFLIENRLSSHLRVIAKRPSGD